MSVRSPLESRAEEVFFFTFRFQEPAPVASFFLFSPRNA